MSEYLVGPFLEELRLEKEMELEEAASMIGVDVQELLLWEEGAQYPTINYIHSLANVYGVSVNEIVEGRHLNEEVLFTEEDEAWPETEYATEVDIEEDDYKAEPSETYKVRRREWLGSITAVFAFVIVACIIIDILSIGRITWSGIAGVSIVFAWGLILPLFFRLASAVMSSLVAFSVLIIPYLFVLDMVIGTESILMNVAVPITVVTLVYLWAMYFVYTRLNLSLRRFLAVVAIGAAPVSFIINYVISMQFNVPLFTVWNILSIIILIAIGVGLIYWENRRNQPPAPPIE